MATSYDWLAKIYINCSSHVTEMANTAIYCKKLFKYLLLWNQKANGIGTWYVATRFAHMMNQGWPWPTLWLDQIWFLMHLYGENLEMFIYL